MILFCVLLIVGTILEQESYVLNKLILKGMSCPEQYKTELEIMYIPLEYSFPPLLLTELPTPKRMHSLIMKHEQGPCRKLNLRKKAMYVSCTA
jgi:hypothetical protein